MKKIDEEYQADLVSLILEKNHLSSALVNFCLDDAI
jgi:hypothetical protein